MTRVCQAELQAAARTQSERTLSLRPKLQPDRQHISGASESDQQGVKAYSVRSYKREGEGEGCK